MSEGADLQPSDNLHAIRLTEALPSQSFFERVFIAITSVNRTDLVVEFGCH